MTMLGSSISESIHTMDIRRDTVVNASLEITWESVLAEIGPESQMPDGKPFPFKLEAWPGGRWFRDLGNNTGHLWGHVQVIKPPKLLELVGPMPMSYPAVNHVQYRLTDEGGGRTRVSLVHRAMGLIPEEHRDGMPEGWEFGLKRIREIAEARAKSSKR